MRRVYTVGARLVAEDGPLHSQGFHDFQHPNWWLRELSSGPFSRLLLVTHGLWAPATPSALCVMLQNLVGTLAMDTRHIEHNRGAVELAAAFMTRLCRDVKKTWPVLWRAMLQQACGVDVVTALAPTSVAYMLAAGTLPLDFYDCYLDYSEVPTWL